MSASFQRRGFSLIELLIVVTVVVILSAIILPSVRLVRDVANTAKCGSNLRQLGAFVMQFANENNGRLPGSGHKGTGSQSWCDIINLELLSDEKVKLPRMTDPPGSNLLCPAYDPPPSSWRRCFTFNVQGLGGSLDTSVSPQVSKYGLVYDPPTKRSEAYSGWQYLCLGAPLSRFSDLSNKVLLQENERASDGANSSWPAGSMVQGDDPGYPPYCAHGGTFAFRHRGGTMANFLYFDQHVECRRVSGDLNQPSRYGF